MQPMADHDRRELLKRAADLYQYCLDQGWPYQAPAFDLWQCGRCGLLRPVAPMPRPQALGECYNRDCRSTEHWIWHGQTDVNGGSEIAQMLLALLASAYRGMVALPPNRVLDFSLDLPHRRFRQH